MPRRRPPAVPRGRPRTRCRPRSPRAAGSGRGQPRCRRSRSRAEQVGRAHLLRHQVRGRRQVPRQLGGGAIGVVADARVEDPLVLPLDLRGCRCAGVRSRDSARSSPRRAGSAAGATPSRPRRRARSGRRCGRCALQEYRRVLAPGRTRSGARRAVSASALGEAAGRPANRERLEHEPHLVGVAQVVEGQLADARARGAGRGRRGRGSPAAAPPREPARCSCRAAPRAPPAGAARPGAARRTGSSPAARRAQPRPSSGAVCVQERPRLQRHEPIVSRS